jgi:two-component system sensor histidine kinase BaeS
MLLDTLRRRLVLSHVLPLLVIIPIMGITLIYVLETNILLADLSRELVGHAALAAELSKDQPLIWGNPILAEDFANRVNQYLIVRVMLITPDGRLLASSDQSDADRLGQVLTYPGLTNALAGEVSVGTTYSQRLQSDVVDVWMPVIGPDQQIAGVLRLTRQFASVQQQFLQLRYLTLGVLAAGLFLGSAIGLFLALNMERSLRQVTQAIYGLASGQPLAPLPEQGPEEIRLLARAVNTLVDRLRSLEQARRHLLANLVHELGRPLGALCSALEALEGGASEDFALRQELLVGVKSEVGRLQRLLDDLARLHDQVVGTLELARRSVVLSEWLPPALVPWRAAAYDKGLQWEFTLPSEPVVLEIDPDRLAQALGNLLSNAIKYTPSGGTVSVGTGTQGEEIWIKVSDTGPGIAAADRTRIFTPFYRGQTGGRFPQGMGLGLSIARDLVAAHGGRLDFETVPGRGSRFIIWVPLVPRKN